MTARAALVLAVLASLVPAATASAKGVSKVVVCGAAGCRDVTHRVDGMALTELGAETGGPTAHGPGFVRVRVTIGNGGPEHLVVTQLYVPARDIVATREDAGGWVWTRPLPETSAQLRRVARGVRPLPAARLPVAAVRTDPAPRPVPVAATTAGAGGGGMPAWAWPLGGLAVLLGAWAARRHMRA